MSVRRRSGGEWRGRVLALGGGGLRQCRLSSIDHRLLTSGIAKETSADDGQRGKAND